MGEESSLVSGVSSVSEGRTKCERYSRIVGYLRPLQQWNEGKQAEWHDRKVFVVNDGKKEMVVC